MDIWNSFEGDKHYVIGNHDMDGGFSREQVVGYWKSEGKYYSFDTKGIHYLQINSMSYQWLGGDYQHVRYSKEVDEKFPWIKYTVPYKDSLFAVVTIDTARGFLEIEGRQSEFVGPSPWEIGASREELDAATLVPKISDWKTPV